MAEDVVETGAAAEAPTLHPRYEYISAFRLDAHRLIDYFYAIIEQRLQADIPMVVLTVSHHVSGDPQLGDCDGHGA